LVFGKKNEIIKNEEKGNLIERKRRVSNNAIDPRVLYGRQVRASVV
jgi:hypothetical protein